MYLEIMNINYLFLIIFFLILHSKFFIFEFHFSFDLFTHYIFQFADINFFLNHLTPSDTEFGN